ncbi:sce7725 family protein [Oceanobacillus locisalsi]|uniref:Sce7725 family protein n=1 Tax=Oceanobacillus locisalsi TaxID=546107 RepID=A0ABW3NGQ4_9BACI
MYFPYLRGRQYELIAIRELVENDLIGPKIIPIIEPVKPSSTFKKTIDVFIKNEHKLAVVHNPQVASYLKALASLEEGLLKSELENIYEQENIIFSHILNDKSEDELIGFETIRNEDMLVIVNEVDFIEEYKDIFHDELPRFTLVPDESAFRRNIREDKILLEDRFKKQKRNADYAEVTDEFYSEDHLYYKSDGYIGFSDYSIVGSDYFDSGFAPFAVVIHIVYLDEEEKLRIKHFVSDSNDDINDPAGKFYEALQKLMAWQKEVEVDTFAMREFKKFYENETYPGLGTVKKLSIMHHLEIVNQYFEEYTR